MILTERSSDKVIEKVYKVAVRRNKDGPYACVEVRGRMIDKYEILVLLAGMKPAKMYEVVEKWAGRLERKHRELRPLLLNQKAVKLQYYWTKPRNWGGDGPHVCKFEKTNEQIQTRGGYDQVERARTEKIIGYKYWKLDHDKQLILSSYGGEWLPLMPFKAQCTYNGCTKRPCMNCSCGIYASRQPITTYYDGDVRGTVQLWGKILEGEKGYRAEYAYPDSFTVDNSEQAEILKVYGVPIFINTPKLIHKPDFDWRAELWT